MKIFLPIAVLAVTNAVVQASRAVTTLSASEKVGLFLHARSRAHKQSLERIMKNMTVDAAVDQLRNHSNNPKLLSLLEDVSAETDHHYHHHRNLRKHSEIAVGRKRKGNKGNSLDSARDMLNSMIEEVQEKYEMELETCCTYDATQSGLMEQCRQDVSMFNAEAAEAREEMLASQEQIDICEKKLPELTDTLNQHNQECHDEATAFREELKIVLQDIAVISNVLEMTDCGPKKSAAASSFIACEDTCTGTQHVDLNHPDLHDTAGKIKSAATRKLVQESLVAVYRELDGGSPAIKGGPEAEKRTMTESGPCKAPVPADKRSGKCSIKTNPQCEKLQEKFMGIQTGIVDKKTELQEQLATLEKECELTKGNLEAQIDDFETRLKEQLSKLAAATAKNSGAEEQGRLKTQESKELAEGYAAMTTTCHTNYGNYESEECGLKKIRGELYKMSDPKATAFFQDCVVSEWAPGECSVTCGKGGGTMTLTRSISAHPVGGAACPPLMKIEKCNDMPCPIDCIVEDWSGWSKCSAGCGGGVYERLRGVDTEPMHGGEPCGETTEAGNCNLGACDKDCVLSDWGAWGDCSKECNYGISERIRNMLEDVVGNGQCSDVHGEERLQMKSCNEQPCLKIIAENPTLQCNSDVDVIILLDGSGSLGEEGWEATKVAGAALARAFPDNSAAPNAFDGCTMPGSEENRDPATASERVSVASIRCCSNDGAQCFTQTLEGGCGDHLVDKTFQEAEMFCAKQGYRLCSSTELTDNKCCATGCDLDGSLIWSLPPGSAKLAVELFSGPRYYSEYERCVGNSKDAPDMEADCRIYWVSHFTSETEAVAGKIEALAWPQSTTLTSVALDSAETELGLGRDNAQSIVVVITDGVPLSPLNTAAAAKRLRDKARLVWVPVTKYAPLADIKEWASFPPEQNVIQIDDFSKLGDAATIDNIISGLCKRVQ